MSNIEDEDAALANLKAPIQLPGLDLDMYGGDREHDPRHFHIRKNDDWEIVVLFRRCALEQEIVFDVSFPASKRDTGWFPLKKNQRKELLEQIIAHLDELDEQWEELNPGKG